MRFLGTISYPIYLYHGWGLGLGAWFTACRRLPIRHRPDGERDWGNRFVLIVERPFALEEKVRVTFCPSRDARQQPARDRSDDVDVFQRSIPHSTLALEPVRRVTGAELLAATRALEESQWLDERVLRERQLVQLRRLLQRVHANNPFHRKRFDEAGVRPEEIQSLDDLRRLPILTKADARDHGHMMLSAGYDRANLMQAKTGGSTGKPVELYFTEGVSQLRNASGRRNKKWAGWNVGEPTGAVWGNPIVPRTLRERVRTWVLASTIRSTPCQSRPSQSAHSSASGAVKPTMLFGHAHSLFVLANMIDELSIRHIRPRAIIASSMMLLPHERAVMERVFEVAVTDIYGCEEWG
jgi:phenylacetate-CoA ligase